jgi:hypothetical protein
VGVTNVVVEALLRGGEIGADGEIIHNGTGFYRSAEGIPVGEDRALGSGGDGVQPGVREGLHDGRDVGWVVRRDDDPAAPALTPATFPTATELP